MDVSDLEQRRRRSPDLKVGDIIVEFNGKPVESAQDLIAKVSGTSPEQIGYDHLSSRERDANLNAAPRICGSASDRRGQP